MKKEIDYDSLPYEVQVQMPAVMRLPGYTKIMYHPANYHLVKFAGDESEVSRYLVKDGEDLVSVDAYKVRIGLRPEEKLNVVVLKGFGKKHAEKVMKAHEEAYLRLHEGFTPGDFALCLYPSVIIPGKEMGQKP